MNLEESKLKDELEELERTMLPKRLFSNLIILCGVFLFGLGGYFHYSGQPEKINENGHIFSLLIGFLSLFSAIESLLTGKAFFSQWKDISRDKNPFLFYVNVVFSILFAMGFFYMSYLLFSGEIQL